MSSGFGENSKPKPTNDAFRNSSYWDKLEERKKAEKEKAEQAEKESDK